MQAVFVRLHPAAACNILSLEDKRDKTWGLVLSNCACSRMFTSWKNGEIMQTNDWKMQVRERQKEQVPKKCNWKMQLWKKQKWEMEKMQKKNHTRDQLDKHDFGKSCKKLGKSKKNCKSDQGPTRQTWFWKKSCKNQVKCMKNAKKCELRFCTCIFLAFVICMFFCIVFCTCIFSSHFWFAFFAVHGAFFKIAVF